MPTGYVKKLAKKHHTSVGKSEDRWERAKKQAAKQGHSEDFAYITGIYKKMMGEDAKSLGLAQFLIVTEMDDVGDISYGSPDDDEEDLDIELDSEEDLGDEEFDLDTEEDLGDEECDPETDECDGEDDHRLADVLGPDDLKDEDEVELEGMGEGEGTTFKMKLKNRFHRIDKRLGKIAKKRSEKWPNEPHIPGTGKETQRDLSKGKKIDYKRAAAEMKEKGMKFPSKPKPTHSNESETPLLASLLEKWKEGADIPESKKGMFKGRTKASLESELSKLKESGPYTKGSAEYTRMKELMFALRAKSNWGEVD